MIKIKNVIDKLLSAGIYIFVDNGRLKTRADKAALTSGIVSLIKDNKEELLNYFSEEFVRNMPILPREVDNAQLSFAQQRLWLLDKIDGGSAHYNMPGALRLTGQLEVGALEQAFSTILKRHESLRTVFSENEGGEPIQVIQAITEFNIPLVDLSLFSEVEQTTNLSVLVAEEASKVFDLSTDTMLRAQLVKMHKDEHVLLVTMHHIASDGWSMGILINEFSALYSAYVRGEANPLPALEIQYADYAHWQRNWLQGEVLDEQLGYWQTQLAALPVVHSLPLDKTRPKLQAFSGATHHSIIPASISTKLTQLCQDVNGTLFMGLHAAFSVLLARYSNETDIVVGSPIANREQAEVANLIGFFVNTLVLRSDLSDNPSFSELLEQSKQMLLDAYAHQQVPFEQIVEALQPERSMAHSPLFQVMLVLQNNEKGTLELPDVTLSPVAQSGSIAKYDLTLNVAETSEGLQLGWNYKTDLFNAETIERLAKHFELLLTGLLKQPEDNVFSIDMLPAEEVHQQLIEWNDTAADYPKDKCIHELFEAQVATNPDAVAVVFEDKQLTYGELNAKANQLARYLIEERQVTPDTLVGICIERSLEMIVGIMAILKAGGAYVPLDPSYPKARLEYMLADASLSTVLTQYRLQDETPVTQAQRVTIDSEELLTQLQAYSADNVVIQELNSNHLAYVIYTSGSTGAPKGVMVEHSGLVNFACFDQSILKINVKSQILNTLSLGFDAGNGYLFGAMSAGATLHLIYPFNNICDYILENGISHLGLTPSILNDLALEKMESLRFVISGGDELNINALDKISSHTKLYNAYGPTENTIAATYSQINVEQISGIGKPNANIQCYILSDSLSLSPIGVAGELHIGGAGLARGYLHNPKLTANKFIENPFYDANNASSSERLYKTGDLVRWLPDGNLEFLGRIDHQVKIRGFRIELGEIEHQLLSYDEVNDAVVVALSTEEGDKRLVGYVTHDDAVQMLDDSDDAQALRHDFIDSIRHQLQQDLPDYMVPSAFVVLESLPLTPGGKVDRKSLPAPDMSLQQKTYVAPTTETEQKLCEIWQEVLGIERVGITDNFFELGGHSLLVTKLITMINKSFDILIPVKIAFEIQTVESFSIVLQECEILKDIEGKEGRFPVQNEISITIK